MIVSILAKLLFSTFIEMSGLRHKYKQVSCPRLHSWTKADPGLDPRAWGFQTPHLSSPTPTQATCMN